MIKKNKNIFIFPLGIIVILTFVIVLTINNHNKSEGVEFVIGMSQANLIEPWRIAMNQEIIQESKKYNNIKIIYRDAGGDSDKQKRDINELINDGSDLLIVSISDSQKLTPLISDIYKSKPIIVLDRAVEGYDYTLYIGPDNESIGRQAGNLACDLIGNKKGNIMEVQGLLGSPPVVERSNGFRQVIKEFSNIKISSTIIGEWQRDEAEDKILQALKEDSNINVIFAHNDYMALGAYRAVHSLGLQNIKIIGVDGLTGENGGLDLVSKKIIQGTFTYTTGGKEAVDYAEDILNKKGDIPKKIILRSDKVTSENVNDYLKAKAVKKIDNKKIVLGYAQLKSESNWRTANEESIKEAAKKSGIDLVFLEAGTTQLDQKKLIRELIKKKVDIIAFSPFVVNGWDDVLEEAKNAKIPVIICDRTVNSDNSLWISNIGSDFYEEGRRAAKQLVALYGEKETKILELRGNLDATPTIDRENGFNEIIGDLSNYKIVNSPIGNFSFSGGKSAMENYLKLEGRGINVVYAQNDDMALGAIQAIKDYGLKPGKDVTVIGIDATKEALKAVKKGEMYCTIECNPLLGPQLMKAVNQVVKGIEVPVRIVNAEDIFTKALSDKIINNRKY